MGRKELSLSSFFHCIALCIKHLEAYLEQKQATFETQSQLNAQNFVITISKYLTKAKSDQACDFSAFLPCCAELPPKTADNTAIRSNHRSICNKKNRITVLDQETGLHLHAEKVSLSPKTQTVSSTVWDFVKQRLNKMM